MSNTKHSILHWVPRILGILFALFLSLFTFDAWEGVSNFWEGLLGWFIHLLPVFIFLFVFVVAWRWPRIGGVMLLVLAVAFAVFFASGERGNWVDNALSILLIAGPMVLLGMLFLLESRKAPPEPGLQA